LVTGAAGFIGSRVVALLLRRGAPDVVGVGRSFADVTDPAPPTGLRQFQLDLHDGSAVREFAAAFGPFDTVFHCAGRIDQAVRDGVYAEQFGLHVQCTLNLVEALQATGSVHKFVHVGSNAEYGNAPVPHGPTCWESPNSAYGVSKLSASKLVLAKAASESFPAVVARPFLVYGPGQSSRSFLSVALAAAKAGQRFPTTGGEQTRDFVHVDKVAEDLLLAAEENGAIGRVINICSGVELRLREVLDEVRACYPAFRPDFGAIPYRATELMRSVGVAYRSIDRDEVVTGLRDFACGYAEES
jgi:nucleoside-diphosphate-sugar epimerase